MKLSILIPTLPSRVEFLSRLMGVLEPQLTDEVELLWFGDNKRRSVGAKRNELLRMAQGKYLTFIDDDDLVSCYYVSEILAATESNADVIVYEQTVTINGGPPKRCIYGIEYDYSDTPELWTGLPAHTMTWKSEIAKRHEFPDMNYTEDSNWVARAVQDVQSQHRINKILYAYQFDKRTSETRNHVRKNRRVSQRHAPEKLP